VFAGLRFFRRRPDEGHHGCVNQVRLEGAQYASRVPARQPCAFRKLAIEVSALSAHQPQRIK
jgi:hypothetical protein